jgi:hypothetical protein
VFRPDLSIEWSIYIIIIIHKEDIRLWKKFG